MGIFEKLLFQPTPQTALPPTICYNVGGVWHQIVCFYGFYLGGWEFEVLFFSPGIWKVLVSLRYPPFTLIERRDSPPHLFRHLTQGWNSPSAQPPSTGLYPNPQIAKQSHWKSLPEGNYRYTICLANLLICFRAQWVNIILFG